MTTPARIVGQDRPDFNARSNKSIQYERRGCKNSHQYPYMRSLRIECITGTAFGRLEGVKVFTALACTPDGKLSLHIQMYSGVLTQFVSLPASFSPSSGAHLEESGFTLPSRAETAELCESSSLPAAAPKVYLSTHARRRSSRLSGQGLTAEDLNWEAVDAPPTRPSSSAVLSTPAPTESMDLLDVIEWRSMMNNVPKEAHLIKIPNLTAEPFQISMACTERIYQQT
ncbi:hypothetical protein VP01_1322g2 [Puccinia sorghi]|uniref:Uncharacterized protein n=1 Tax=Puccinia sorghi TaxID=27349 RepID=A0A0L6VN63_9BASI|nr:hypothetical protein VP01_1323g2 [Puccinia sorghi]KNZ62024.1 hypothetical protein VP01_1322g2 [Puccinia sorghi]